MNRYLYCSGYSSLHQRLFILNGKTPETIEDFFVRQAQVLGISYDPQRQRNDLLASYGVRFVDPARTAPIDPTDTFNMYNAFREANGLGMDELGALAGAARNYNEQD